MKSFQASIAPARPLGPEVVETLVARVLAAPARLLLLDYDGTLVPFVENPALARPDDQLLALLHALAGSVGTEVHVVSGRTRGALEGGRRPPIGLHASTGSRPARRNLDLVTRVLLLLDRRPRRRGAHADGSPRGRWARRRRNTPGVAAISGRRAGRPASARFRRSPVLAGAPMLICWTPKTIEASAPSTRSWSRPSRWPPTGALVAIGDDRTDEDCFGVDRQAAWPFTLGLGQPARRQPGGPTGARPPDAQQLPEPGGSDRAILNSALSQPLFYDLEERGPMAHRSPRRDVRSVDRQRPAELDGGVFLLKRDRRPGGDGGISTSDGGLLSCETRTGLHGAARGVDGSLGTTAGGCSLEENMRRHHTLEAWPMRTGPGRGTSGALRAGMDVTSERPQGAFCSVLPRVVGADRRRERAPP